MTRRQAHDRLPRGWRVTGLYVIVDQACVARCTIEALPKIFEEDPHQHCADGEADECQSRCRGQLVGHILGWACVCHHREPPTQWMPRRFATGTGEVDILSGSSCYCQEIRAGYRQGLWK